jgi:hypothetical protein
MFVVVNTYRSESEADDTTVSQAMTADYEGAARGFAPFFGCEVPRQLDDDFQSLKQIGAQSSRCLR